MRSVVGPTLVALAMLATACAPPASVQPASRAEAPPSAPKRLAVGILGEPYTLSQAINTAGTGSVRGVGEVERMIHAGLTTLNGRGERVPMLAEQAVSVENGQWRVFPDGAMETQWVIRPDARWHDGTPLTSADFVFTARVYQDRELTFPQGPGFAAIGSVEGPDARTVLVKWKTTFIEANELFSYGFMLPLPRHLLEGPYLTNKEAFMDLPYWTTDFVGAGAYRLRAFERSSHLEVQAFREYPLGTPRIQEILVKFLQDPNVLIANLLAGDIEMTLGRGLSLDQALEMQRRWNGRMHAELGNWLAHYVQQGDTANPPLLREVSFRRALLHAMDRQAISEELTGGRSPIAHAFLSPANADYRAVESQIVKYDYDPRRAAQLIEQFGYQKRADGLYYDAQGQKLSFQSQTNAGDDFKDKILFATADQWKRVGVDVDIFISPRQLASDRVYRATLPGMDLVRQPFDPIRLHSNDIPRPENNWVGSNRQRYANPELDGLIDAYYVTISLNERRNIIGRMLRLLTDQAIPLGTIYDVGPTLIGARLLNVAEDLAAEANVVWNVHEWDLR